MNKRQFESELSKREAKGKSTHHGNVRELAGITADIIYENCTIIFDGYNIMKPIGIKGKTVMMLWKDGERRAKRRGKK